MQILTRQYCAYAGYPRVTKDEYETFVHTFFGSSRDW